MWSAGHRRGLFSFGDARQVQARPVSREGEQSVPRGTAGERTRPTGARRVTSDLS